MNKPSLFRRFVADRSGNYAVIFAIMLLPILAGVGLSIDYSYALQSKTRLHDANDAAALFAAIEYRKTGKLPAVGKVKNFVVADFAKAGDEGEPVIVDYKLDSGKIYLTTKVDIPTSIMGLFGHSSTEAAVKSVVNIGKDEDIEIALALDVTYSMTKPSGSSAVQLDPTGEFLPPDTASVDRITALKVAALKFNAAIFGTTSKALRRIAVVPFARHVNVGMAQRSQPWLNVPADTAATGKSCYKSFEVIGYSTTDCTTVSGTYDGVPYSYQSCAPIYGPNEVETCYDTGASMWHGCVGSRVEPYNLKEGFLAQKFPGLMDTWCGVEILPLSADKVEVANRISGLWAEEYTYIPEGVMWGWRMLTPGAPFEEAKASTKAKKIRKIMVLMTDGENQASAQLPGSPFHYGTDFAQADDWTAKACAAAKKDGIEIYSVTFGTDLTATAKNIIRNCATTPANYYDASNAEKLVAAFQQIAASINSMYLTN